MKTLLILRHAKTLPQGAEGSDHQRMLTAPGAAQARHLGKQLRKRGVVFDRVLCSSARRARDTAEAVLAGCGSRAPLMLTDVLYNASGESMLALLESQPEPDASILLVAHMPGVAELAEVVAAGTVKGALHFKPGMLAELELDIPRWQDLHRGCGRLHALLPP